MCFQELVSILSILGSCSPNQSGLRCPLVHMVTYQITWRQIIGSWAGKLQESICFLKEQLMATGNKEIVLVQSEYNGQMNTTSPLNDQHKKILKDFLRSYRKSNILIKPYESFWTYIDGMKFYANEEIQARIEYILGSWSDWGNPHINPSERTNSYKFTMKEKLLANTTKTHFASKIEGYNYPRVFLGWLAFQLDIFDNIPYSLT
jgi:hypothetical protein